MALTEKLLREMLDFDEARAARARMVISDQPVDEPEMAPLTAGWGDRQADAQRRGCRTALPRVALSALVVDASLAVGLSLHRAGEQASAALDDGGQLIAPPLLGQDEER